MTVLRRLMRWLWPGLGVKRWIVLGALGLALVGFGAGTIAAPPTGETGMTGAVHRALASVAPLWLFGALLVAAGAVVTFWGMRQMVRSIVSVVSPKDHGRLAEALYAKRCLAEGPRLVALGGGTGLSTLLRGLKLYSANITAIVTVSDDGGSSGRLRRDLGILPPGDIRNCLVALADVEPLMTELFQYRFDEKAGQGLEGHSFGNLLIALAGVTGDFKLAVEETSKVLAIRGRVLPSTLTNVHLKAEMDDGSVLEGETTIADSPRRIARLQLEPPDAPPLDETLRAIQDADVIIVGPGSLYTSVLPNLLAPGVVDAIKRAPAPAIYVCNVMTQPGETDGFTAARHLQELIEHIGCNPFTVCLMNSRLPESAVLAAYHREGAEPVRAEYTDVRDLGSRPVVADLLWSADLARHDPTKLAAAVMRILDEAERPGTLAV